MRHHNYPKSTKSRLPFGSPLVGRNFEADEKLGYKFGFNGKEKDDETYGEGNTLDFGARIYDGRLGRWMGLDPLSRKYPFINPFSFVLNNPIIATDPDGKDVYLIIYTTKKGDPGHAAIAVENYIKKETKVMESGKEITKTTYEGTGTFTIYELGPAGQISNALEAGIDKSPFYGKSEPTAIITEDAIINQDNSHYETTAPEGVIKFDTDYETDSKVTEALDKFQKDNPMYNGRTANCSDYALAGVKAAIGVNIEAKEPIMMNMFETTTPHELYKKSSEAENASVTKNAGDQVSLDFTSAYEGTTPEPPKKKKD